MKKNISINISGIIFHIEEDGYENLRRYLDSINRYFSSFEDSSEIMADIESRIAEIFLSKLNEGKQVITAEDVNSLITTMGSVSDFKAAEEQEFTQNSGTSESSYHAGTEPGSSATGEQGAGYSAPKRLMRDQKRKILGGVCSGLANYMNVDAVWIRLLFALLGFAWGFTIIVYIVMWILVPGSYELSEIEAGKKMYRDPEHKVLGGVSGGVAAYLNFDIWAVRILFVILAFAAGLGIFVYIVLWIIVPEAKTLTDRMQMQGEPVTLSNIESNIKRSQSGGAVAEESTFTKILLFPFRLIGMLLQALARVIVPLIEVLRVIIGVLIVFVGIGFAFSAIVAGGIALGIFSASALAMPWMVEYNEIGIPLDAMTRAFPGWIVLAGFLGALIPSVFVILLGISIVARKVVFGATLGWSLFVLFFVCVVILSVGIPKIVYAFKERGEYKIETNYQPTGKKAIMKINEVGMDDYDGVSLMLKGHSEPYFRLVQEFNAQGTTRQKAIENAQMVDYHVGLQDSVFTFDSNILFKPDAIFRGQELQMTLYIPYNYPFVMDESFSEFVSYFTHHEYRDGYTWKMTEEGMECVTCPEPDKEAEQMANLRDFDELDLRGIFDVRINRGDDYSVELTGPDSERSKYNIYRSGETLVIDFEGKKRFNWDWDFDKVITDEVRINITMPSLEKLEAIGFGTIRFDQFHVDDVEIDVRGPIKVRGELHADDVMINLSGKSEVDLTGRANKLNADLEFASRLKAYGFEVTDAIVEVKGASVAKVNVSGTLETEEGAASDVDYRGNPQHVIKRD
jgi:phage shock protein PspC (stress-responsive transcriptional regulator)